MSFIQINGIGRFLSKIFVPFSLDKRDHVLEQKPSLIIFFTRFIWVLFTHCIKVNLWSLRKKQRAKRRKNFMFSIKYRNVNSWAF